MTLGWWCCCKTFSALEGGRLKTRKLWLCGVSFSLSLSVLKTRNNNELWSLSPGLLFWGVICALQKRGWNHPVSQVLGVYGPCSFFPCAKRGDNCSGSVIKIQGKIFFFHSRVHLFKGVLMPNHHARIFGGFNICLLSWPPFFNFCKKYSVREDLIKVDWRHKWLDMINYLDSHRKELLKLLFSFSLLSLFFPLSFSPLSLLCIYLNIVLS